MNSITSTYERPSTVPTFYSCNKCVCRPSIILDRTLGYYPVTWARTCTVQTFNSCTRQPDVRQCSTCTSMTNIACEAKLRSIRSSSMCPCPGNWIAFLNHVLDIAFNTYYPIMLRYQRLHDIGHI